MLFHPSFPHRRSLTNLSEEVSAMVAAAIRNARFITCRVGQDHMEAEP